jgi:hypothetical protein
MTKAKGYGTKELLEIFDSLPDIRILAQEECKRRNEADINSVLATMKADYIKKRETFVCSEVSTDKQTMEYDFFR